jgi:predicted nucleotidyltransferase
MSLVEQLKARRVEILGAAARHGARNVRIFGSVARGEERPDSDIDLLVDFDPGRSVFDHAGLWLELQALLGRKVDIVTLGGLRERTRASILAEAVPL